MAVVRILQTKFPNFGVCLWVKLPYYYRMSEGIWNLQQQQRQQRIDRATAGTIGRLQSNTRVAIYIAWNGMAESDKRKRAIALSLSKGM